MICASTHRRGPSGAPSRSQLKTGRSSPYTPNLRVPGVRGHGYFVHASSVARVRLSPTDAPDSSTVLASSRVRSRRVWALPSKPPHGSATSCSACSPLWPKGGWPRSWASAAVSAMSGCEPRARDRSRATWATSRLCVSRLRTKSSICGPCTWVLAASRREAAACTTRARSRSYGVRSGASTRLGGSATSRSRSCSSYSPVLSIERDSMAMVEEGALRPSRNQLSSGFRVPRDDSVDAHVDVVEVVRRGRAAVREEPPALGGTDRRPDVLAPEDVEQVQLGGVLLEELRDRVAELYIAGHDVERLAAGVLAVVVPAAVRRDLREGVAD